MENGSALPGEFAEDGQSDNALASPWPTANDDDGFLISLSGSFNRVEDELVGQLLFIKQDELFAVAYLVCGNFQQCL